LDLPAGFFAKIGRAEEHLSALQQATVRHTTPGEAYSIRDVRDPKKGLFQFFIVVREPADLEHWSLVAGDFVHNCRSALDYVFWELVLNEHRGVAPKEAHNAKFPVCAAKTHFAAKSVERLIGAKAMAVVESVQPYNDPRGKAASWLWLLHTLNNTDKHRLLIPSVCAQTGQFISIEPVFGRPPAVDFGEKRESLDIKDGTKILEFTTAHPENVMNVHLGTTYGVVLKVEHKQYPLIPTLAKLLDFTKDIGGVFARSL
jgi:hypothetical protein